MSLVNPYFRQDSTLTLRNKKSQYNLTRLTSSEFDKVDLMNLTST